MVRVPKGAVGVGDIDACHPGGLHGVLRLHTAFWYEYYDEYSSEESVARSHSTLLTCRITPKWIPRPSLPQGAPPDLLVKWKGLVHLRVILQVSRIEPGYSG